MNSLHQSIIERQQSVVSVAKSDHGFRIPSLRNYAMVSKEGNFSYADSLSRMDKIDESKMAIKFIVSTVSPDREGDIVLPQACIPTLESYRLNPVIFFNHQLIPLPIASSTSPEGNFTFTPEENRITSWAFFHGKTAESNTIFHLVATKQLNGASIGFNPIEAERLPRRKGTAPYYELDGQSGKRPMNGLPGWLFKLIEVIEWSVCGIQANSEAIAIGLSKGCINGDCLSPAMRKALQPYAVPMSGAVRSGYNPVKGGLVLKAYGQGKKLTQRSRDELWEKQLAKGTGPRPAQFDMAGIKAPWETDNGRFDIADEPAPPLTCMIDWVSKYLRVPIKKVYQTSLTLPYVRIGSFVTGLRLALNKDYKVEDTRRLHYNGGEVPPNYETIQLNSKAKDTFLMNGTQFLRGPGGPESGLIIDHEKDYFGRLNLTFYCSNSMAESALSKIESAKEWAANNNFLKGEKFALSGAFLEKTNEDWDDLFLEQENAKAVRRVLDRMNTKGGSFANHGSVFSGPPGTGKTLSVRILMNKADATFIWVSARDFYDFGSFSGMTTAFDMAKELAPSIVVFEDCDNWMNDSSIDFVKSEMDGVSRYKGVWTILTTNFPERLPEALIDRPGRFHDVLQFQLPSIEARKMMFKKWVPGISSAKLTKAIGDTNDYSGAHIYHLAAFAKSLQESEQIPIDESVELALQKVKEQRDLITGIQLEGSRYRPPGRYTGGMEDMIERKLSFASSARKLKYLTIKG